MNQEKFVKIIREVVTESSIEGTVSRLEKPPGRSPNAKLLETSNWYNNLGNDEKKNVKNIIEMAVDDSVFGFLCVIDGVRSVAESNEEGLFKLTYVQPNSEIILNDPDDDYLHDIYNS